MNVMLDGLFQQESLGLSVLFRHRDEFLIKLCVDCRTNLDRRSVSHGAPLHYSNPTASDVKINLDSAR